MMIACTLLAATAAFALFGLATERHHAPRLARHRVPLDAARMRVGAWAMVALAFLCGWVAWGPVYGPIAAIGMLMLGAGVSFLALNLLPPKVAARRSAQVPRVAAASEMNLSFSSSPRA